jgi:hypothetical protein
MHCSAFMLPTCVAENLAGLLDPLAWPPVTVNA